MVDHGAMQGWEGAPGMVTHVGIYMADRYVMLMLRNFVDGEIQRFNCFSSLFRFKLLFHALAL